MGHPGQTVDSPPSPDDNRRAARHSPARLDHLDGLRALAALYVVLHHAWMTIWPAEYQRYPTGALATLTNWLAYGHFAVSAFIVVSGFCLMLLVVRHGGTLQAGARGFFRKRARRILPPYYFALVVSALLGVTIIASPTGTHWDVSLPVTLPALYAHLILMQNFVYSGSINHVLWSVAVECQIYLLFPLLVILWRRPGAVTTVIGALAISYAIYFGFKYLGIIPPDGASAIVPQYVGLFALGMAGATLAFGPPERLRPLLRWIPWSLLAICMMAIVCVLNSIYNMFDAAYSDIFIGFAITCALIGTSRAQQGPLRRVLSWRPLVFVGTMSYSLYLIHAPLLQVLWQYAVHPWHLPDDVAFIALVIGTPLIVLAAYLFFLVCERPFLASPPPLQPWIARLATSIPARRIVAALHQKTPAGAFAVEDDLGR